MCRERRLPAPTSQALVKMPNGRYYLDLRWAQYRVVVEVDGIQHTWVEEVIGDSLRHNDVTLTGQTVLRLPLVGLRLATDAFFDQIAAALVAGGWEPEAAA